MSFTGDLAGPSPPADGVEAVVTTALDPTPDQRDRARRLARELKVPFVERRRKGLSHLAEAPTLRLPGFAAVSARPVVVVERSGLAVWVGETRLVYHPGMALHRLRQLERGLSDPMLEAMALEGGETVIDATLGLGSDALVAAYAVGEAGKVVGLEAVAILAVLVREGLKSYPWPQADYREAADRIEVRIDDHLRFLEGAQPGSADVVYFDAMFERPLSGSASMVAWRRLARPGAVLPQALALARRVARRRVVVKDRRDSARLDQLGPPQRLGGRSSRVVYGVWPAIGR